MDLPLPGSRHRSTRSAKAAKRFLGKALRGLKDPTKLNTDKAPSYGAAIAELIAPETEHRHLNNVLEADHGKLKMLIKPVRGFKSMPTAYATIKGSRSCAPYARAGGRPAGRATIERSFGTPRP
jgi:transposase-like protein